MAKLLETYVVQPDHSAKLEEIASHEFVKLQQDAIRPGGEKWLPTWQKILFTTSDCVVVQEVQMTWNVTRFKVRKIHVEEWDDVFVEWTDKNQETFYDGEFWIRECWNDGARMYGARV